MTNEFNNFASKLEKSLELMREFISAYESGDMSPYHLKRKLEGVKNDLTKLEETFSKLKAPEESSLVEEWELYGDREYRFLSRTELESPDAFKNLQGKRFEIWSNPPDEIRLPFSCIKPLEFNEELKLLRTRRDNGFIIYEVRE